MEFLDEEQRQRALEQTAIRKSNTASSYDITIITRDGTNKDLSASGTPILDADGVFQGAVHAIVDVTESKQAEEALRKSEARNRAVVETATDGIITMTTNGIIGSFNPAAERIFGYSVEEAVGQPLRMLMPERFRGPHEVGLRRYLEGGELRVVGKGPVELAGLRKGGEEFPLELSLGEMREEEDILFTGIIRDVTERKRAEEELRKNNALVQLLRAVATASNEASSIEAAMQTCIDEVCAYTGWPLGHAYLRPFAGEVPGDMVVSTSIWCVEGTGRFEVFREATETTDFTSGVGLPGRVLASGKPAWIPDLSKDPNFPRAKQAEEGGIRASFAFPVLVEKDVAAVLEFFSMFRTRRCVDDRLYETTGSKKLWTPANLRPLVPTSPAQKPLDGNRELCRSRIKDHARKC